MASGVPVVCSSASSLPEVVGEAALLFDPSDTRGLAERLVAGAESVALRADLRARGLARAAGFRWRDTAAGTVRAYEDAVREPGR
jgi:glycosyltransferase involved in cell wall biosynthesis